MSKAIRAVFVVIALAGAARAWWIEDGIRVTGSTSSPADQAICSDSADGVIVVYQANVQRIDGHGRLLWGEGGIDLFEPPVGAGISEIVGDGEGGAIVVWLDWSGGSPTLRGQRVTADGAILWAGGGVAIAGVPTHIYYPTVAADGSGGVLVAWADDRTGTYYVYAQRVNGSGTVLWNEGGVPLCTDPTGQWGPQVCSDESGGAVVAWTDYRPGINASDIYAQKVRDNGSVAWATDGIPICAAAYSQDLPAIVTDRGGGAIIAWRDSRGTGGIFAQRVDAWGTTRWTADGVAVGGTTTAIDDLRPAADGHGGAFLAWMEVRTAGNPDIFAQWVDSAGNVQWAAAGIAVCSEIDAQEEPHVVPDGAGGLIVTWQDARYGYSDIYAQRLDGGGSARWSARGVPLCEAPSYQRVPVVATDGEGGALVVWEDLRPGAPGLHAQRIDRHGYWGYAAGELAGVTDVPGDQGGQAEVAWQGSRLDQWPDLVIESYSVWRAIVQAKRAPVDVATSPAAAAAATSPLVWKQRAGGRTFYWELVGSQAAHHLESYAFTAATLFDSTATVDAPHYFQVVAHGTAFDQYWVSAPDSGWSVDNLAPSTPAGLAGHAIYDPQGLNLSWLANPEPDLAQYVLHRGATPDFEPGPGTIVAAVSETEVVDPDWTPGSYYKLAAVDLHDNLSAYAVLSPLDVTGSGGEVVPAVTRLECVNPNPFNPQVTITYRLAETAMATLRIHDPAGRSVRVLVGGIEEAGLHRVTWDGRDDAGTALASGVYLCRLEAAGAVLSRKLTLVR
ncbi:MAG TPA: FlgD immunoglobulin-like domain containing protein [Candidatus Krumholzibacteria bacterium]|nr:FlgD immunoglobulin-like domain containing protein [Candidatus Krumholzibacteria bacterium]HPD70450.1 FlgD immunoglobulin-like domain containing protein [Candidatus Krumholzibacteria bacterium]HRY39850.1 FlgD immunoglobulin-like domain containing protein [Candidatus Krumholzibacteria bacterium]